jgi:hypothetical protein
VDNLAWATMKDRERFLDEERALRAALRLTTDDRTVIEAADRYAEAARDRGAERIRKRRVTPPTEMAYVEQRLAFAELARRELGRPVVALHDPPDSKFQRHHQH